LFGLWNWFGPNGQLVDELAKPKVCRVYVGRTRGGQNGNDEVARGT